MLGISKKMLTKIAIMTVLATGATVLASAAEARTYHHYRGVSSAHRSGALAYAPPAYAPPPVYAYRAPLSSGYRRYRNDWQLQGHSGS